MHLPFRSVVGVAALAMLPACGGSSTAGTVAQAVVQTAILPRMPVTPTFSANTVPPNGDVNPYGVAFVPSGFPSRGTIVAGDIIVANFNNKANAQGTGTTVVKVKPHGRPVVFYSDPTAPGFSTALGVLSSGFVLLGNVPSANGTGVCADQAKDVGAGSLMIIDSRGNLVQRLVSNSVLNGPWDLTVDDLGSTAHVFVSNVNTGTVTRLDLDTPFGMAPTVTAMTEIAMGYTHQCDPNAFVVGPTGLAFDSLHHVLYVAATGDNAIYKISDADTTANDVVLGTQVPFADAGTFFHGPLALALANNGDLISTQGDAINFNQNLQSQIVEITGDGTFVANFSVEPTASGAAFGIFLKENGAAFRFAAVDDNLNTLDVWDESM
jgi:hypothetical protein